MSVIEAAIDTARGVIKLTTQIELTLAMHRCNYKYPVPYDEEIYREITEEAQFVWSFGMSRDGHMDYNAIWWSDTLKRFKNLNFTLISDVEVEWTIVDRWSGTAEELCKAMDGKNHHILFY